MPHPYTSDDFAGALDAQKCQEVVIRFMALFDAGDFAAMEQHFVQALVWQRPEGSVKGVQQFREVMAKRDPKMQVRHVITNRHLPATAGTLPAPLNGPASVGRYRDELVREGGNWKICNKETRLDFKAA